MDLATSMHLSNPPLVINSIALCCIPTQDNTQALSGQMIAEAPIFFSKLQTV